MEQRVIVYGDIHGCLDELKKLREKIKPQKEDREISVGDFLNKGADSYGTLKYIQAHSILSVRGNNEEKIIRFYHEIKEGKLSFDDIRKSEASLIKSLTKEDIAFLESLPYYIKIANLTVVHGGIPEGVALKEPLSDYAKKWLTQLRFYDKDGNPLPFRAFEERDKFWSEVYDGREGFVVFGHHPFKEPKIDKFAIGIDTGCVYGGSLTAVAFPWINDRVFVEDYKLYRLNAKLNYHQTLQKAQA